MGFATLRKPAGRCGGIAFCKRSENLGVWGVVGAKPEQDLEMGGGEGCAGEQFSTSCTVSQLGDGGLLIPPRPNFGGWFVGGCGVGDGWGRCSQAGHVFSGTSLAVWGTGGAGVGSTPARQESQGGMPGYASSG